MDTLERQKLKGKERVVTRIDSSSLTHPYSDDTSLRKTKKPVRIINDLKREGKDVVLVSSGTIATGRQVLHHPRPTSLIRKQAFAAIGQAKLMTVYQKLFAEYNQHTAQILITKDTMINDFSRYNTQNTFDELLKLGVVPIINENDIVSMSEIPYVDNFGDNDRLSATVAALVGADLLTLSSDIDGLYTDGLRKDQDARLISVVPEVTPEFLSMGKETSGSDVDTGGMAVKLAAARIATDSGSGMVIANGEDVGVIYQIMAGEGKGILLMAHGNLSSDLIHYVHNEYQDNQQRIESEITIGQSKTDRINTLYHKSRSVGLTEEEEKERAGLRIEYITVIRSNMRANSNSISIQEEDGSMTDLGRKFGSIKEVQQAQGGIGMKLTEIGNSAKETTAMLNTLEPLQRNQGLQVVTRSLLDGEQETPDANGQNVVRAVVNGMSPSLVDRLKLIPARVRAMADGLLQVVALDDSAGEVLSMKNRPNGLVIGQKRVPIGMIGIAYEVRPNITADAFGLYLKTDDAMILKGGSDALQSNLAIASQIQRGFTSMGLPANAAQLIENANRETTKELMRIDDYVDVLIPRDGAGLIKTVVENNTIPVAETGIGNCHTFVDEPADFDMTLDTIYNAKTQGIGVCNVCESLVAHQVITKGFLLLPKKRLDEKEAETRGDEESCALVEGLVPAMEEDWGRECLDYTLSLKLVDSIEETIHRINHYNTDHFEAIIISDCNHTQKFLNEIDATTIYVNASTRFAGGEELEFDAEIGISTQKLHARGPMGLRELTSTKYITYGSGQMWS